MKRFLIIFLCLLAASCQKELPARLEVAQSTLSAESAAGGQSLDIVSTHSWTVRTDVPWCKVIPSSGNGGVDAVTSLYILFEENAYHYARNCTITLSSGGLTQTVTLTQNHRQGVLVPVAEYDLGPEATSLEVPLWKTTAYTAEVDAACKDWLQITQTRSMSEGALVVEVGENPSVAREGTIHLRCNGKQEEITIRQSCGFVKFSDSEFERACLERCDWDRDGKVSVDEARTLESLVLYNVAAFQGLEHFANLKHLGVFVSGDAVLDVTPLAALQSLSVYNARNLIVRGNPKLQRLDVSDYGNNPLEVRDCPALAYLSVITSETPRITIDACPSLAELNLSSLNGLGSLDLTGLPALQRCYVVNCGILSQITAADLPRLESLEVQQNPSLTELGLSACPVLAQLVCFDSALQHLDLSAVPGLETFRCSNTPLKALDLSGSRNLRYLTFMATGLEALDLSGTPALEIFECYDTPVLEMDFTGMQHLNSIQMTGCALVSLTAKDNPELWFLECPSNKLESLEVEDCGKLHTLRFNNNQVHSLTGFVRVGALEELYCDYNLLTELPVGGMPQLRDLFCTYNQLSSLDLRGNLNLSQVSTYGNPGLTDIYLRTGQEIYYLGYDETVTTLHYTD